MAAPSQSTALPGKKGFEHSLPLFCYDSGSSRVSKAAGRRVFFSAPSDKDAYSFRLRATIITWGTDGWFVTEGPHSEEILKTRSDESMTEFFFSWQIIRWHVSLFLGVTIAEASAKLPEMNL